jgi:hypothetical protein
MASQSNCESHLCPANLSRPLVKLSTGFRSLWKNWFASISPSPSELRTAEYSVRPSLPFWRHFPFAFHLAFYGG